MVHYQQQVQKVMRSLLPERRSALTASECELLAHLYLQPGQFSFHRPSPLAPGAGFCAPGPVLCRFDPWYAPQSAKVNAGPAFRPLWPSFAPEGKIPKKGPRAGAEKDNLQKQRHFLPFECLFRRKKII